MSDGQAQKPVVISLHGIRTRGVWQKALAELLSANDVIASSSDYGYLSLAGFLLRAMLRGKADWFLSEYERISKGHKQHLAEAPVPRHPSLVAHSFGTFVAGYSMLKYEQIKFETVIICGSILPRDFPWWKLFQRNQVLAVRHEYGAKDIWTKLCGSLVPYTGWSGSAGFQFDEPGFEQVEYEDYRHSDFFHESHMAEEWLPRLKAKRRRYAIRQGRALETEVELASILDQTKEIDEKVFGSVAGYREVEPPMELARRWVATDPDIYTWLIDGEDGRYVGYTNTIFVSPDRFGDLIGDGIPDKQISEAAMHPATLGGQVCLCALSIAVDPGIRRVGEGLGSTQVHALLRGLCAKLMHLARYRCLRVLEIGAVGWTDEGRQLCENVLRLRQVASDRLRHPIYRQRLELADLKKRGAYKPLQHLAQLYEKLGL